MEIKTMQPIRRCAALSAACLLAATAALADASTIGKELGAPVRLADGEEYALAPDALVAQGEQLFAAVWTDQEGGGRPLSKGTGAPLADPDAPLVFPRNMNRVSAPDANSCAGCHAQPFGHVGGEGDFVANVFVLGQRFDFATFDHDDVIPTRGGVDESGDVQTLASIANSRATTGMFGAGYLEMLAREITADLQAIRNGLGAGQSAPLRSKDIFYGVLTRRADGSWDVSGVEGLATPSLRTTGADDPPSLVIRPWHQASAVVSLREFTNNAMNHHHGIQTVERFGAGTDPDGDDYADEMSRADVTAATVFQAALAVPGRVIPRDRDVELAILLGEEKFMQIGCADCHVPSLRLSETGHLYVEPNPFNPPGNLRPGEAPDLVIDLNDRRLPLPRLTVGRHSGITSVPAFTDFKLHDITGGPDDPNREVLDMHFPGGSEEFFVGNGRFITRRLWGVGNTGPYFHHGLYATMREAILAHYGEADAARAAFEALTDHERDAVIEFLKSHQVLPPGTRWQIVDENHRPRRLPRP
jgi:hypothetical protein